MGDYSAKFLYRAMSSSSHNLTRSHLASSSGSRPSVHTFNGSGHLLTAADQPGPGAFGSGDGQMPRLPVHQLGVHSLDYPYQGSRAPTWASHIIMSDEGADFLRLPAPGTHAVPAFVTEYFLLCPLSGWAQYGGDCTARGFRTLFSRSIHRNGL